MTGKFISLNTRGISNYRKRRKIFTWLRKQKPDVVFLQETHSTQGNEVFWQREWGARLIRSHGANNARGVAILIRNNFDCVVEESVIGTNGRSIYNIKSSFQYKVLNSILYTNELLCKIGYISDPNCSFCHQITETVSHISFDCFFLLPFGMRYVKKI